MRSFAPSFDLQFGLSPRLCAGLVMALAISAFPIDSVEAQIRVGGSVEVESFGSWMPGTVTRMTGTGWPYVKYMDARTGRAMESLFPLSRVRAAKPKHLDRIRAPRQWKTADGTFSVTASLIKILPDENVRLKRDDTGALITVPLATLSDSDRNFVALAKKSLGVTDLPDENSAAPAGSSTDATDAANTANADPLLSLPVGDTSGATSISLDPSAKGKFVPDPATATSVPNLSIRRPFPHDKSDFHDDIHVTLSPTYRTAAVTFFNTFVERESKQVRLYHLPTSRSVAEGKIGRNSRVLAISERGDEIATTTGWPAAKVDAIQIWTAQEGKLKATGGWRSAAPRAVGIRAARFIPGHRVLMTAGEFVVLWDVASATATHSFNIQRDAKPVLSANGRNVAVRGKDDHVYVIDLATFKAVRAFPTKLGAVRALAFDSTGTRLAGTGSRGVTVWDLETGAVSADCTMVRPVITDKICWAGKDHVLLGDGTLIHLPTSATVWKYDMGKWTGALNDGKLWTMKWSQQGGGLASVTVPHQEPAAKSATLTKDQLIWVEPSSAQLTIGQVFVGPEQVRQELQKKLTAAGYQLAGAGDLHIEISSERGKTETQGVKDFFSGPFAPATGSITFTPTIVQRKVTYKGHVLYSATQRLTCPNPINLKEGESPQAAANRYCTPTVATYTSVFIPGAGPLLPDGKQYFGQSKLADLAN